MPYLTPDEIPEDDDCRPLSIPASSDWLAIVSGALTELTKPWNWQQEGAVTVDDAVSRMRLMIAQYYTDACDECELPEGGKIIRMNEDFVIEELVDGSWQPATGDYIIPAPEARTEPTSDQRICLAARNAVRVLADTYEELSDSITGGLTVIEAVAALGIFLIGLAIAGLPLVVTSLAAIAIGAWKIGYDAVEFVTNDYWTSEFSSNFTCALIRCATDTAGVVTFDFECINKELIDQIEWLDPTTNSYTLAGQVRWLLAQFGADGLNAAGGTTAETDDDCSECADGWCYKWDFTVDDGGFIADTYGTYIPGVGWQLTLTPSAILIYRDFDLGSAVISKFIPATDNAGGAGVQLAYTENPGFTPLSITKPLPSSTSTGADLLEATPTGSIPGVGWNANGDTGVSVLLVSLEIGHYEGISPMGASNC